MAKDQKQSNAPAAPEGMANAKGTVPAPVLEDQKQSNAPAAPEDSDPEPSMNANKIMPDPIASLKKGAEPDDDDLASKLEDAELQAAVDAKRPLCEPSLKKGLHHKLATYRVTRLDGKDELCCIEEVGPGYSYKTAVPLSL